MITGEVLPGEDAEILIEAVKLDYSGEDDDGITNPVIYVKQYKEAAVQAVGATAVFNSTMGQYLVTIPSTYIPSSGFFDFVLKGDDIIDVLGRIAVNTADAAIAALQAEITAIKGTGWTDETLVGINTAIENIEVTATGGGSEIIITGYTHDASEKTITITDASYLTLKVEQVKKIFNLTKGCEIYDSGNPRKRRLFMETEEERAGIDITITGAVISYIETATMADADKIMIVVFPASA